MTVYVGGGTMVIAFVGAYVLSQSWWVAVPAGIVGLIIGHYIDPLTYWGPNELSDKTNKEEA